MQPESELPIEVMQADRVVETASRAAARQTRFRAGWFEPYLYMAPAVVILGVFHVIPAFYIIWLSFHSSSSLFGSAWLGLSN
ncbi:MAG: hypothetical protein ACRDFX_14280, partial [Chloroflexota bacterium]